MKTIRQILVFPFELLLFCGVAALVVAEVACTLLGQLCQLVEGE